MVGTSSTDWFWQMRPRRMIEAPKSRVDVEDLVRLVLPNFASAINEQLRPAVRFLEQPATRTGRPPLQLGGGAALSPTIPWPTVGTRPLHCVAVADLAQIAQFDEAGLLPSTGRLYFFFDGLAGAFDLADPAAARVVYIDADDDLHVSPRFRPSHPDDSGYAIPAVFAELACLEPWTQWTIPTYDEACFEGIDWYRDDNADRAFWRQWSELEPVSYLTPQMLGWPIPEQGSMAYELPADGDWRLLLQVPGWDGGLTWADVATLYYWIRDTDLRRGHFDDVRAIVQF